jgi:ribosomal protein S18 acetylase RimI-like enzyme
VVSLSVTNSPAKPVQSLRPVNLRTDLAQVADLIEIAFSDSMDNNGRAAVRELRMLSHLGPGLSLLSGGNELTQGISLGYVWEDEGRIVGNVSIYPTNWPSSLGSAWIIANVAVHPSHRRRGIARQLMDASVEMIRQRGGTTAILQVDADNESAHRLYESLGFVSERTWTTWRRGSSIRALPMASTKSVYITRRRRGEWQAEYELAERVRPAAQGGVGWLRPLHPNLFRGTPWGAISNWVSLRSTERLVVHSADEDLAASMWIESGFAASSVQLTLLVDPEYQGYYDDALVNLAVRRYGDRQPLMIEHPADETLIGTVLQQYHFRPQRSLIHMRYDVK